MKKVKISIYTGCEKPSIYGREQSKQSEFTFHRLRDSLFQKFPEIEVIKSPGRVKGAYQIQKKILYHQKMQSLDWPKSKHIIQKVRELDRSEILGKNEHRDRQMISIYDSANSSRYTMLPSMRAPKKKKKMKKKMRTISKVETVKKEKDLQNEFKKAYDKYVQELRMKDKRITMLEQILKDNSISLQ